LEEEEDVAGLDTVLELLDVKVEKLDEVRGGIAAGDCREEEEVVVVEVVVGLGAGGFGGGRGEAAAADEETAEGEGTAMVTCSLWEERLNMNRDMGNNWRAAEEAPAEGHLLGPGPGLAGSGAAGHAPRGRRWRHSSRASAISTNDSRERSPNRQG